MCAYLFVSGLQISYGYPPFIQTNWMTKVRKGTHMPVHALALPVFQAH